MRRECVKGAYLCLFLSLVYKLQVTDGSGRVHIQLRSYQNANGTDYNGKCCDGMFGNSSVGNSSVCKPCDFFIFACVTNKHNQGQCASNNFTSEVFNDTYKITFSPSNYNSEFILHFTLPSRLLDVMFQIYDEDKYDFPPSQQQLIDTISYNIAMLSPLSFTKVPSYSEGDITSTQSRLIIGYFIQCDKDYYYKCDSYCPADPVKYTCDSHGRRHCNPGWEGADCQNFNFCTNQSCLNGGSCTSSPSGINCACLSAFTGSFCEIMITTARTVTSKASSSSSTVNPKTTPNPGTVHSSSVTYSKYLTTTTLSTSLLSTTSRVYQSTSGISNPRMSLPTSIPSTITRVYQSTSSVSKPRMSLPTSLPSTITHVYQSTSGVSNPRMSLPTMSKSSSMKRKVSSIPATHQFSNSASNIQPSSKDTTLVARRQNEFQDKVAKQTRNDESKLTEHLPWKIGIIALIVTGVLMLIIGVVYSLTRKKNKVQNNETEEQGTHLQGITPSTPSKATHAISMVDQKLYW